MSATDQRLVVLESMRLVDDQHSPVDGREGGHVVAHELVRRQEDVKLWLVAVAHATRACGAREATLAVRKLALSAPQEDKYPQNYI